jgi:hypothetical protein
MYVQYVQHTVHRGLSSIWSSGILTNLKNRLCRGAGSSGLYAKGTFRPFRKKDIERELEKVSSPFCL